MAIINCPECGKEISDQAESCPNCGFPIKTETIQKKEPKKKKRSWIIAVAAVVIIALGVGAYLYFSGPKLSAEEQHVYNCVDSYRRMLKDPDSLILRGPCVYVYSADNNRIVLFTASAKNSYGGTVTEIEMFLNGKYIDEYDETFSKNIDVDKMVNDKEYGAHVNDILKCQHAYLGWQLYGEEMTESTIDYAVQIDGKIIARKIGCNYSE